MEIKAKIIAVEEACGGVIIVIQQDRMQIPVAEEPANTDEAIVAKKIARQMKVMGFNIEPFSRPCDAGFRTGFWTAIEEYESLGKPTIGDLLVLNFKVEK